MISAGECSKRWTQLRESFSREKKKRELETRSGSGISKRKGFSLYENMKFLEQHIQKRRTFTNVCKAAPILRTPLTPRSIFENVPTSVRFDPPIGYYIRPGPSSTMPIPIRPPGSLMSTPPSSISTPTSPPSISTPTPPPSISTPTLSPNIPPSTTPPILQTVMTPQSTPMPIPSSDASLSSRTSSPGILTSTPSPSMPTTTFLDTSVFSSPSPSTTFCNTMSPPSPYSPRTPSSYSPTPYYYPTATLSTISNSSFMPTPCTSTSDSSDANWNFDDASCTTILPSTKPGLSSRKNDSRSMYNNSNSRPLPCSQAASASWINSSIVQENPPLPGKLTRATACYNKDLVKTKKIDPLESSFMSLSSTIQNHLSKPISKETEKKSTTSDVVFADLIVTELKNLAEPVRAAKKLRLLQVLYDTE